MTKDQPAAATPPVEAAPAPLDQDALGVKDLARAVLARQFRPRVASIRRLAEAVLAGGKKAKKAKAKKAAKSGGEKKVRKLARIPGQPGR